MSAAASSPLLHGQETGTALDAITKRLYFIWPLTRDQVRWLNTVIYSDDLFHVNYWSLTHAFFGFLWGLVSGVWQTGRGVFSLVNYLVFHTLFELWELWAGGYLGGGRILDVRELMDVVVDTMFGVAGFFLGRFLFFR